MQNEFVVINWDQRETGETLKLNDTNKNVSVSLLQDDAFEMVNYIINSFNRKKLFLISHSWGSVMGFDVAAKHPELLYAYIPISPVVDANNSAVLTVNLLKEWAVKNKNRRAMDELKTIKIPYKDKNDFFLAQKWLFIHNGVEGAETEEFKNIYYGWMNTWFPIWKENAKTNLLKFAL